MVRDHGVLILVCVLLTHHAESSGPAQWPRAATMISSGKFESGGGMVGSGDLGVGSGMVGSAEFETSSGFTGSGELDPGSGSGSAGQVEPDSGDAASGEQSSGGVEPTIPIVTVRVSFTAFGDVSTYADELLRAAVLDTLAEAAGLRSVPDGSALSIIAGSVYIVAVFPMVSEADARAASLALAATMTSAAAATALFSAAGLAVSVESAPLIAVVALAAPTPPPPSPVPHGPPPLPPAAIRPSPMPSTVSLIAAVFSGALLIGWVALWWGSRRRMRRSRQAIAHRAKRNGVIEAEELACSAGRSSRRSGGGRDPDAPTSSPRKEPPSVGGLMHVHARRGSRGASPSYRHAEAVRMPRDAAEAATRLQARTRGILARKRRGRLERTAALRLLLGSMRAELNGRRPRPKALPHTAHGTRSPREQRRAEQQQRAATARAFKPADARARAAGGQPPEGSGRAAQSSRARLASRLEHAREEAERERRALVAEASRGVARAALCRVLEGQAVLALQAAARRLLARRERAGRARRARIDRIEARRLGAAAATIQARARGKQARRRFEAALRRPRWWTTRTRTGRPYRMLAVPDQWDLAIINGQGVARINALLVVPRINALKEKTVAAAAAATAAEERLAALQHTAQMMRRHAQNVRAVAAEADASSARLQVTKHLMSMKTSYV